MTSYIDLVACRVRGRTGLENTAVGLIRGTKNKTRSDVYPFPTPLSNREWYLLLSSTKRIIVHDML